MECNSFQIKILFPLSQSQKTPQMRNLMMKKIKNIYVKKHDKSNTELNINTCIIKLQTLTSNVQE